MRYIFFDTETTGLPKEYDAPITDIDNWPRLVQLAWIIHDNNVVARKNYIIKPLGFTIPNISTKIHGISTEQALERGQKIESVLNNFLEDTKDADVIIGHNIQFDLKIVQSELYRLNIKNNLDQIAVLDTMMLSVNYCKIPNKQHGYRYPKLIELYNKLFSVSFENMHDAMADIEATAKCFWALIDRGIIDKKNYPCLLTLSDRQSLAEKYNMQACVVECKKQRDCDRKAEDLYHKSAELGNTKGMLEVARYAYLRNDNNTALYWLKEIVRLSKRQKVSEYEEALERLVRIYNNTSNSLMAKKYQQLLDSEINNKAKAILANYQKSESDFYKLVLLLKEGMNGSYKDKERAIELMKEGIEKGYRSLFRMYSDYLRNQGDDRYLFYLLEDIKDTEKHLSEEFSFMESSYNKDVAISTYRKHEDYWLTERYRLVAEAFIKGFGIKQDIKEAEKYLWKALGCGSEGKDYETVILLARLYNGEFGTGYRDYNISIEQLKQLPLKYMKNKYPYALLGDAYIGKSWKYFFKSRKNYEEYPEISNYKSALRKKYYIVRNVICLFVIVLVVLILYYTLVN